MYLEFYGLTAKPFELLPDPRFLYVTRGLDLALTRLEEGITDYKPLIVLSGEVGTGKTTLLNFLLRKIGDDTNLAMIVNPNLEPREFLELVLRRFRGDEWIPQGIPLFEELRSFLLEQHAIGRRSILIVDEAQNIPMETLEQVRMLTNLHTHSDNLLQVILSGQHQFRLRLKSPELAELAQRVSVHYHLYPLEEAETERYIQHRLAVSGYSGDARLFSHEAVRQIHHYTNGVPRLINSLCDTALVYGFSEEAHALGLDIVQKIINDRSIQIGGNGDALAQSRGVSGYLERNKASADEGVQPAKKYGGEAPLYRSREARQPQNPERTVQLRENSCCAKEGVKNDEGNNTDFRKKADLIARHYRNLWSLNQENRERLETLGSNYRLLWKHCENLRKQRVSLMAEGRRLKEQLKAKDERIQALEAAFQTLLDENRDLKKRLGHSEIDSENKPEASVDLGHNAYSTSE